MVILDALLVLAQLLFHFGQGPVEGDTCLAGMLCRYKIVLMLGIHQNFRD